MSRLLVITGATGFLGSELIKSLACNFDEIISVSGRRNALKGLSELYDKPFSEADTIDSLESHLRGRQATQVWNCASLLSYNPNLLQQSVEVNTHLPARLLYACKPSEGFFHLSTVGVIDNSVIDKVPEELPTRFPTDNPYVITKSVTEHLLSIISEQLRVPVVIIRTGSLLGNPNNKKEVSNKAGYFTLIQGINKANKRGSYLTLNVDPKAHPPLAHTHHIAEFSADISKKAKDIFSGVSVLHALDQILSINDIVSGINIKYGKTMLALGEPKTSFDSAFALANHENIHFMNESRLFENGVWSYWREEQGISGDSLLKSFIDYMYQHIITSKG